MSTQSWEIDRFYRAETYGQPGISKKKTNRDSKKYLEKCIQIVEFRALDF